MLKEFIKSKLTVSQMDSLHLTLGVSITRRTQIFNRPEKMTGDEIQKLATLLNVEPIDLMNDFHCGWDRLTVSQAKELCDSES